MPDLPKNPKLDDVVAALVDLDRRLAMVEQWRADHTASMRVRQTQIAAIESKTDRDRWLATLKRGRR